jgi:hypothetical protein
MKHVMLSVAAGLALATVVAMPALGQQPRSSSEVVAARFTTEVTGQVQAVDPSSGMLRLQTVDGPVTVRFPPPAVAAIQPGDTVTVAFGLVKPPPSASPPSSSPGSTPGSSMPGSPMPGSPTPGSPTTPGTR